jgi:hypothetical protein
MEKENWIESIINSADGIAKAAPNANLFIKIQSKIKEHEIVSTKWIWLAAASLTLLFLLNAKVVLGSKHKTESSPLESLATSLSNSNQLY